MKKVSVIAAIIAGCILFLTSLQGEGTIFGPIGNVIVGAIIMLLIAVRKSFFDSVTGEWIMKGWKWPLVAVNVIGFVVTMVNVIVPYLTEGGIEVSAPVTTFFVKLVTILNATVLLLNDVILPGMSGKNPSLPDDEKRN